MKYLVCAAVVSAVLPCVGSAGADCITLRPSPPDLYDLPHRYYLTWGIRLDEEIGEVRFTGAQLRFDDICNSDDGPNTLYVHLLDSAPEGVAAHWDNHGGGDDFAGQGVELVTYVDLPPTRQDLIYDFTTEELAALNQYVRNGNDLALGFDPDCHYDNSGVSLNLFHQPVPEPSALALVLAGGALALLRRSRRV